MAALIGGIPEKTNTMPIIPADDSEGELQQALDKISQDSDPISPSGTRGRMVVKKVAYTSPNAFANSLAQGIMNKSGGFKQIILDSIDTAFYTDDEADQDSPSEEEIEIVDYGPDIDDIRSELKSAKE